MIRVSVHLISAVDGSVTELARMDIAHMSHNEKGTVADYMGVSYIGRSTKQLDKQSVSKSGWVRGWRRHEWQVWNLVANMLHQMGYNKGHSLVATKHEDVDISQFL